MTRLASLVCCVGVVMLVGACGTEPSSKTSTATASSSASSTTSAPQPLALTPFVGTWDKHQEKLVIDAAGTGTWTYADVKRCPSCSSAEAPAGTLSFTLTPVSSGMASGAVTASSDADNGAVGDPVTAKIVPGFEGKGVNLVMTIGAGTVRVMCNSTSAGQCGA